jgi:LCP family protein required for cell wall assembly
MIVLHISDRGRKAVGVSIPRDSYVDLADGSGQHKINSAYTAGKLAATSTLSSRGVTGPELEVLAAEQGAKAAIKTVEEFTGLTINHYAVVNLAGFYSIAQSVGGIPVCLNAATSDPTYSGASFPAGPQTIDGANVLAFIRQRHELINGDLDRVRRQQALLAGLAETVVSGGTLTDSAKLDRMLAAAKTAVSVDSGWDAGSLIQVLLRVGGGRVQFTTIPVLSLSLQTPYDGDAVQVDPKQVRSFFRSEFNPNVDDARPAAVAPAPSNPLSVPPPPITSGGLNCVN